MGAAAPVILKVKTPEYKKVVIDASDGKRYHSDLSRFLTVYCFPKTEAEWDTVSVDVTGRALTWTSRFEVHIDQVIGLATKVEDASQSA